LFTLIILAIYCQNLYKEDKICQRHGFGGWFTRSTMPYGITLRTNYRYLNPVELLDSTKGEILQPGSHDYSMCCGIKTLHSYCYDSSNLIVKYLDSTNKLRACILSSEPQGYKGSRVGYFLDCELAAADSLGNCVVIDSRAGKSASTSREFDLLTISILVIYIVRLIYRKLFNKASIG
jgi:hypothetical protein